jgi:hypothetical protein
VVFSLLYFIFARCPPLEHCTVYRQQNI